MVVVLVYALALHDVVMPCFWVLAERPSDKYYKAAKLATAMEKGLHYNVDEKQKSILITEDGYEAAEDVLEVCQQSKVIVI